MSKEAMKLALDDLISEYHMENSSFAKRVDEIFREALAEPPAQQDSPWCMKMNGCKTKCEDCPDEVPKQPVQPMAEQFCDNHCTWLNHHPDCDKAEQPAQSTADKSELETVPAKGRLLPAQQEQVAWMKPHPKCDSACLFQCTHGFTQFPECATTPQAPAREPLTDEQIEREWQFLHDEEGNPPDHHDFARAIEAARRHHERKHMTTQQKETHDHTTSRTTTYCRPTERTGIPHRADKTD